MEGREKRETQQMFPHFSFFFFSFSFFFFRVSLLSFFHTFLFV